MGGCCASKPNKAEDEGRIVEKEKRRGSSKKEYSWDKKEKVNPKDYTIENVKDQEVGKLPGEVKGQQFIIQNCENVGIYIFDHSAQVTVDDCKNCRIFLGPVRGSVFLRNCTDCSCVIACQQFRTRDCRRLRLFLHCSTQPIIEASTEMKFACFQYNYEELEDQFKSAEISLFNNNWYSVHDFTPAAGDEEANWKLLPEETKVEDYVPLPTLEKCQNLKISTHPKDSIVPYATSSQRRKTNQSCLVVFFSDGGQTERARNFLNEMRESHPNCNLIQSKEVSVSEEDSRRVFASEAYTSIVKLAMIRLRFCQLMFLHCLLSTTTCSYTNEDYSLIDNFDCVVASSSGVSMKLSALQCAHACSINILCSSINYNQQDKQCEFVTEQRGTSDYLIALKHRPGWVNLDPDTSDKYWYKDPPAKNIVPIDGSSIVGKTFYFELEIKPGTTSRTQVNFKDSGGKVVFDMGTRYDVNPPNFQMAAQKVGSTKWLPTVRCDNQSVTPPELGKHVMEVGVHSTHFTVTINKAFCHNYTHVHPPDVITTMTMSKCKIYRWCAV